MISVRVILGSVSSLSTLDIFIFQVLERLETLLKITSKHTLN